MEKTVPHGRFQSFLDGLLLHDVMVSPLIIKLQCDTPESLFLTPCVVVLSNPTEKSIMVTAPQDIQMPRFGKAGTGGNDGWGDGDGFDVDMLTEFLLNDGTLNSSGVTFDFS